MIKIVRYDENHFRIKAFNSLGESVSVFPNIFPTHEEAQAFLDKNIETQRGPAPVGSEAVKLSSNQETGKVTTSTPVVEAPLPPEATGQPTVAPADVSAELPPKA